MMILGGFIDVMGIAAIAVAFTVLNAATGGIAGLVLASIGVAALVAGSGLFVKVASDTSSETLIEVAQG